MNRRMQSYNPEGTKPTSKGTQPVPLVYRHVAFDLVSFDALKAIQRNLEGQQRRSLTNAEVLRHVLLMHQE